VPVLTKRDLAPVYSHLRSTRRDHTSTDYSRYLLAFTLL